MKLDISQGLETGLAVNVEIDTAEVGVVDEMAELVGNLQLTARVRKAGEEVLLEGRLCGTFDLACCRCLERFGRPFDIEISATYVQAPASELESGDVGTSVGETKIGFLGNNIDLISGIREDLLLNVPLKPLCSGDCRGLCPQCGINLNEEKCACGRETVDPRLAALRDIKTEMVRQRKEERSNG